MRSRSTIERSPCIDLRETADVARCSLLAMVTDAAYCAKCPSWKSKRKAVAQSMPPIALASSPAPAKRLTPAERSFNSRKARYAAKCPALHSPCPTPGSCASPIVSGCLHLASNGKYPRASDIEEYERDEARRPQ